MPCDPFKMVTKDGQVVTGFVCSRGQRKRELCKSCGSPSEVQCDFPVTRNGKPGTCDRHQCRKCAVRVGPNKDYCGAHARVEAAKQGTLKGIE